LLLEKIAASPFLQSRSIEIGVKRKCWKRCFLTVSSGGNRTGYSIPPKTNIELITSERRSNLLSQFELAKLTIWNSFLLYFLINKLKIFVFSKNFFFQFFIV